MAREGRAWGEEAVPGEGGGGGGAVSTRGRLTLTPRLGVSCVVQFSEAFVPSFLEVTPSSISSLQVWLFAQVTVTGSAVAEKLSF